MKSTVERVDTEELVKILSDEAPIGSCIMQDGKFCYVNSYFSSDTGYTANELVGKDSFKIVAPEDREIVRENTIKMLKGELISPYQFRVICKDGSIRWVMAAVKSVQYHGRRAILGNYMEATEHKKIEDAMRESEERYRVLSEEAPAGVCIMQDGRFCYINSKFPIAIGYTVDELVGKDSLEIVVPEDRKMARENTIKMLKGELSSPYQFRVICRDGSIIWVMAAVRSIQYRGRRATLGSYMEITERKQMEEALKEREESYRELADSITDVFFAMDDRLRYTYWNKASEVLTGIRAEDAIGKSLPEIFPDTPGIRRAKKVYREVLRTQQPQTFMTDYADRDGKHYIFEISTYPSQGGISVFVRDITEHKQAEEKLRESEERYRALFDRSLDCIYVHDLEGNFLDANKTALKLLGYKSEDISHLNFASLISQDQLPKALTTLQELKDTGAQKQANEFRLRCKDGSFVDVEVIAAIIYRNGKPYAVQGVGRDITEHKQADEKLKESEQKYRLLFETSPDCIAQLDREGRYLAANPAVAKSLGVPVEELIGKTVFEVVPQEVAQRRLGILRKALDEWQPQIFEDERAERHFHHIVVPTKISEQKEVVQVITRDITDREQAEEALRQSEERYRTILEEMEDAYFEVDLGGHLTFVNNSVCRNLGYSREELIGTSYKDFTAEDDIESVFRVFNKVYRTSLPNKGFPWKTIHKDGICGFTETSISLLRNGKGDIIGFRGVGRDITERKQAEENLRQSEEKYRALFDSSVIGMFVMDAETMKIVMANQAAATMMGFSSVEEAIGINPINFVHPDDKDKALEITIKEMFEQDLRRTHEYRVVNKDGREGWVSVTGARIMHESRLAGLVSITDITERKQAEEALRQSEERYRTMLEEMEDAYSELDLGGHFTFVNNSVCRDLGYSREELMGMSYKKFTAEDDIESLFRAFNEVYQTGVPNKGFSWKTTRKDGTQGFAESSISPMRNSKDEIIGFCSVGRDITERKQTEEKLRQSRENYRALFDSSVIGAVVVDAETMKVVIANQAALKMFGFSSPEGGVNPLDFSPPDDREKNIERLAKEVFEKDSRKSIDLPAVTKDGKEIWVSVTGAKITHKGRLAGLLSFTDITERKRAEEALRQSEENYRALFDSTVIGTIVIDAETMKAVMANQAAAKMFGLSSAEEALEVDPLDFILPEDKERIVEIAEKNLFEQNSQLTYDLGAVTKDGRKIWISATGARIMHEGRLAGLISFTDITEKRQQNERLIMADRLASIGELAAGTAHELNNPLTSVIGFAQLLMEKDTPDYIRRDLAFIKSEAQRAITVTSNLLTFARKHTPEKRLNQINEIIEGILQLRAYAHKSNGIEIERHLAHNLPEIMVDYFQMQQVFLNIIINAEYFITEAHKVGTLTVTTRKHNNTVMISFADDGSGIPPEDLKHIFDPFFTTKEPGKGTGLGLSICHGIIAEHGGQIYAKSQPGKGATIFVELPINGSDHIRSVP